MQPVLILKYGVVISFLVCIVSLSILVLKTFSYGNKGLYAAPKGDVKKGIVYAFGKGMMPWEKESAGSHLPSYIAGILYHIGIFFSLLYLLIFIIPIHLPQLPVLVFQSVCLVGFIAGVGLLIKRLSSLHMRALSCPDDLAANIIVDVFLILTVLHTLFPALTPYFFLAAIIMFLYIPFGKIRHCFFFFYVRILFGIFYGRRDVFPPKSHKA